MEPSARVLLDSMSPLGHRLTTMEVVMHRFVLAEFNTHRVFSRNSASSRAIPFGKTAARVMTDGAYPVEWTSEQAGMQGGSGLAPEDKRRADALWTEARTAALRCAVEMSAYGVHKSICNRLLEPFLWHTVIVSSTEWENFWRQRCSPLAQPEMRAAAEAMKAAFDASIPTEIEEGWHLPLLQEDEADLSLKQQMQISVARCARVSYLTHDGIRSIDKDLELFVRLSSAEPPHASPFEHVARPLSRYEKAMGNFVGWQQFRYVLFGR